MQCSGSTDAWGRPKVEFAGLAAVKQTSSEGKLRSLGVSGEEGLDFFSGRN